MKIKLFFIVVAVLALSSFEWVMNKLSCLVLSKLKETEEN
jgi:hypothetical protein